jgi:hypothetical protein
VGLWSRTVVIIDGANLVGAMQRELPTGGRQLTPWELTPDLGQVEWVLQHFGIEVERFEVAVPAEPVELLDSSPREHQRERMIRDGLGWVTREQRRLGEDRVRLLRAGTDGNAEIGVDAMCVLAAMHAARSGADSILLLSEDQDVHIAQDYVDEVPVVIGGRFDARKRSQLGRDHRRWIDLRSWGLTAMAPPERQPPGHTLPEVTRAEADGGATVLSAAEPSGQVAVSSPLTGDTTSQVLQARRRAAQGAATMAVVDAYGLSQTATRAIGLAKLPTPATVDELVRQLGWEGPVAQLATVPQITRRFVSAVGLDTPNHQALVQRDRELRRLIDDYRNDGDARTQVRTGRLATERERSAEPDLRRIEEKKVTTILAADVYWALTHTSLPVVVLSDRAELTYLLERLDAFDVDATGRCTRVGVHARPVRLSKQTDIADTDVDDDLGGTRETLGLVLLNRHLTAELVALERELHGPELAAAIHRELVDESIEWQMVRFDLETRGAVLSPTSRPEVEAVFHRMLELDCEVARHLLEGGQVPAGALPVDIHYDPGLPCSMPVLRSTPRRVTETDIAVVVEHDGARVHVDTDGSGYANTVLPTGHGPEAYRPDQVVLLRRLAPEDGGVRLVGPVKPIDDPQGMPVVVAYRDDGTVHDLESDRMGVLHEILGARDLHREPGEWLLAFPLADGSFQALSTGLPHLQEFQRASTG